MEKNVQSMMAKDHFDTLGFSADATKKPFHRIRYSRDNSLKVTFEAPLTCGVKEMKCSFTLVWYCIGDNKANLTKISDRRFKVIVSLRDMAKFITGRSTITERKGIFDSLCRIANMSMRVEKKPMAVEVDQRIKEIRTQWIYDIRSVDSYETAEVEINQSFINIIEQSGIGYNLSRLMKYNGRAALLYAALQGYKFKRGRRYEYFHHIPHERLIECLDLEEVKEPLNQVKKIKAAFKDVGLNYEYNKRALRWEKGLKDSK